MIVETMNLIAGGGIMIPADGIDKMSIQTEWSNGATSAEVRVRLNYTGMVGDGVDFGSAVVLTKTTKLAAALDVQSAPYIEVVTETAAAGEHVMIYGYAYQTR